MNQKSFDIRFRFVLFFEFLSLLGAGILPLVTAKNLFSHIKDTEHLLWSFLALFLGILSADFMGGFVHWSLDRYGSEQTPIIGKRHIADFRYHHVDPKEITRHSFIYTNGGNGMAALLVLVPAFILSQEPSHLFTTSFLLSLGVFALFTNQIHKWAHEDSPPRWVIFLQKAGFLLSPQHHKKHHTAPFQSHYCITNGWCNFILGPLQFHRRLEALLKKVLNFKPYF